MGELLVPHANEGGHLTSEPDYMLTRFPYPLRWMPVAEVGLVVNTPGVLTKARRF